MKLDLSGLVGPAAFVIVVCTYFVTDCASSHARQPEPSGEQMAAACRRSCEATGLEVAHWSSFTLICECTRKAGAP
jgi:hypothetical protein